ATDRWHSDHMYMPEPAMATVLRAVRVPSVGGDTCFLSMAAAYDDLAPDLQALLEDTTAVNTPELAVAAIEGQDIYKGDIKKDMPPPSVHPVIRIHPESKRRVLFVAASYTTRIVELGPPPSDAVLHRLLEHHQNPNFHCP